MNVLWFMSDEHNPRYTSPYGHPLVRTPTMDAMATEGVVYDAAYCPSPLCLPSRSSVMAGKRVHEIQAYNNSNANLDPTPLSYGQCLADQGVYSAYVGKTDVYAPGATLGFSEMLLPDDRVWPGDVNLRRRPVANRENAEKRAKGYGPKEDASAKDLAWIDTAVQWLTQTAPQLDQPWVFTVNTYSPHFPHFALPEDWDLYPEGEDLPEYGPDYDSAKHPFAMSLRRHFRTEQFSEEDMKGLRRGYLACATFVDRQLKRLIDTLEDTGQRDSTLIIYTSDHGEMLGKFGMWWKCSLYEDSSRVPLIVSGPGFPKGQRVRTAVDLHDVRATVFSAAGAVQPSDWLGTPLQDIAPNDSERSVFSEYHGHGVPASSYMIRKSNWKLMYHVGAPHQLFDMNADPEELTNLYTTKPDVADSLERELRSICDPELEDARTEEFVEAQLSTMERETP